MATATSVHAIVLCTGETCCGNPEHCLKSNIVLFGILDEDKKLSFKYFNDTTRLQFIFTAQLLIHNDKTLSLALL